MARRNNEPFSGADRAKVRVFFAEVEGNNESIQEALKTMVLAMSRPVRFISEQNANGNAAVLLQRGEAEVVEKAIDQVEDVEAVREESAPPNARKPRGTGKKVDRNAGLNLVPDLDFRPSGKQALKEFVDKKTQKRSRSCPGDRALHAARHGFDQDRSSSCDDRLQGSWKSNSCRRQTNDPQRQEVKDVVELHRH